MLILSLHWWFCHCNFHFVTTMLSYDFITAVSILSLQCWFCHCHVPLFFTAMLISHCSSILSLQCPFCHCKAEFVAAMLILSLCSRVAILHFATVEALLVSQNFALATVKQWQRPLVIATMACRQPKTGLHIWTVPWRSPFDEIRTVPVYHFGYRPCRIWFCVKMLRRSDILI